MNTFETRRLNLDRLIGNHGVHGRIAIFAKEHDLDASYLSQLLNNHRKLGEKAAHNIEDALKVPRGTLDKPLSAGRENSDASAIAKDLGDEAVTLLELYQAASPELRTAALRVLESHLHSHTVKPIPPTQK